MFATMRDVRNANCAAGLHWFEASTMEFFRSRVETEVINGRYFITSESEPDPDAKRWFTVRVARDNGIVGTVGEFMEWATLIDALNAVPEK